MIPIKKVGEVRRQEASVKGTVTTLWAPSHPGIQQVGLLEAETGRIKFTVWKRSEKTMVREGEKVKIQDAAKNW